MQPDEWVLILLLLFVVIPVGILLIRFSTHIGKWFYDFDVEFYSGSTWLTRFSKIPLSWQWFYVKFGKSYYVWFIRVIGGGLIAMSVFALLGVLFF